MEKPKIIILHETVAHSLIKDAGTVLACFAIMAPGWFLEITAMQWTGFVMFWVYVLSYAANKGNQMTPEQAKAFIESLEAKGRK